MKVKVRGKEGISEGDVFLCIKDASYSNDDPIFKVGRIYKSYVNGCICDENRNSYHSFTRPYWTQYLVKIVSSNDYDDAIAQKLNMARLLRKYGYTYNFKTKEIIKKED